MLKLDIKEITEDVILTLLNNHSTANLQKLEKYYRGKHDILDREMKDETKPNNKLVSNFPAYIVDTIQGYFISKPTAYSSENEE